MMPTGIITNVVGLLILFTNVLTQNNTTTSKFTTNQIKKEQEPLNDEEKLNDEVDRLFKQNERFIYGARPNETDIQKFYDAFKNNVKIINYLNNFYKTAKFSVNAYTHYTFDEFTNWFTGFNGSGLTNDDVILFDRSIVHNLPPVMDWSGDILETYHQETKCKISYVFSALSNIEAQFFSSNGNIKVASSLSVRQAFECERQGSCKYGGVPHYVFKALKDTGGVSLMYMYPYFQFPYVKGDVCQTVENNVVMVIDHYIRLKVNEEEDLLYVLAYYGPVVTTIFVSESIRHYSRGVLDPGDCGNNATNHAVLLDGYGVDNVYNLPYWLVKNTWEAWGDNGHIRLIRGNGFVCNLGREYIATAFVQPKRYFG